MNLSFPLMSRGLSRGAGYIKLQNYRSNIRPGDRNFATLWGTLAASQLDPLKWLYLSCYQKKKKERNMYEYISTSVFSTRWLWIRNQQLYKSTTDTKSTTLFKNRLSIYFVCSGLWRGALPTRHARPLSRAQFFVNPWTAAHQAPLSMGFPRQEYWTGLPFPPSGDLPVPETEPVSCTPCIGRWVLYHWATWHPLGTWEVLLNK